MTSGDYGGGDGFLIYKGKPLVRKDNILYYGSMAQDVVAMLVVESSYDYKGLSVSDSVELKLILTDPSVDLQNVMVKRSVRKGLFDALDIAGIWIDRYIKKNA